MIHIDQDLITDLHSGNRQTVLTAIKEIGFNISNGLMEQGASINDVNSILNRIAITDNQTKLRRYTLTKQNRCYTCDSKENLELHHIKSQAEYPKEKYDPNNVVILCRECHKIVHREVTKENTDPCIKKATRVFKHMINQKVNNHE